MKKFLSFLSGLGVGLSDVRGAVFRCVLFPYRVVGRRFIPVATIALVAFSVLIPVASPVAPRCGLALFSLRGVIPDEEIARTSVLFSLRCLVALRYATSVTLFPLRGSLFP